MLSIDKAAELADLDSKTTRNWIGMKVIAPAYPGGPKGGRGRSHRLSTVQAVGLVVAERIRRTAGACLGYVGMVVEAFAEMSEGELRSRLEGPEHCVQGVYRTAEGGPFVYWEAPDPDRPDLVDVRPIYETVRRAAVAARSKPKPVRLGRRR